MDDANFNRRQTIRVGASVAYAQVGVVGFDGPIDRKRSLGALLSRVGMNVLGRLQA